MVLSLVIGIAINPFASHARIQPGIEFALKSILRCAIALLGIRIGLADIAEIGASTVALIDANGTKLARDFPLQLDFMP
jgi:uncharacterized membrane protein YadS